MFQEFPYSDMHQLNLDWIIKIAKDFLDQYTHIQELISNGEESLQNLTEEGLQQLQDKADALEALLQEWYNTHSEDIANQLANALSDLNNWYSIHEHYLDQTLADKTAAFNDAADAKAATTIASIPSDYTTLSNDVTDLKSAFNKLGAIPPGLYADGTIIMNTPDYNAGDVIYYDFDAKVGKAGCLLFYNSSGTLLDSVGRTGNYGAAVRYTGEKTLPENYAYTVTAGGSAALEIYDVHLTDSYLMPRNSIEEKLNPSYAFVRKSGIILPGTYANETKIFTVDDFPIGTEVYYDFDVIQYEASGLALRNANGTDLQFIGFLQSGTHSSLKFNGKLTIPAGFSYAVLTSSTNYPDSTVLHVFPVRRIESATSLLVTRDDIAGEYKTISPKYINSIVDGNGNQDLSATKYCMSLYLNIPSKKVKISFESPWTVYLLGYDTIANKQPNPTIISDGWKTAGTYEFTYSSKYIRLLVSKTGYNTDITPTEVSEGITVSIIGELEETGLSNYVLTTIGDSITYGTDPDNDPGQISNPWPNRVANIDQFGNIINNGVASARVLGYPAPNPPPAVWSRDYNTVPLCSDIITVMVGINDMASAKAGYSGYVLGNMDDRTTESFYGGLHVMWQGLIDRFPPSSGKKLMMIMYPYDPDYADMWDDWMGACINVAEYYGIPILDLQKELGISVAGDPDHDYWREYQGGGVNVHPTQTLANLFADTIANFINAHFGMN